MNDLSLGLFALLAGAFAATPAHADEWPLPAAGEAAQPSLVVQGDTLLLSWIERAADGHRLRMARWSGEAFSDSELIASGNDWFVNWADFPALQPFGNGALQAFVLQKLAAAPYAYSVMLTRRADAQSAWSAPAAVHDDGSASEHGFVAQWAWQDDVGVAWLDGRNSAADDHHGHGGAMSLRAARLDSDGRKLAEWQLDGRTCDCCQTDAAMTSNGPVLVFRDRSEGEIRDIAVVRWTGSAWSQPARVHADNWHMPGCPVNGPAVVADGQQVWVAWYTEANAEPRIQLAHSGDGGASFAAPQVIAEGSEVLGRVDLVRSASGAIWIAWIRESAQQQSLQLSEVAVDGGLQTRSIAAIGRGRGTGFPRLALLGDELYAVWTDTREQRPQVRGARIAITSVSAMAKPSR